MRPRIYALWFFAAGIVQAIGSALDVSWHFSRLFDEYSPPHLITACGFLVNLALVYWALARVRVTGVERTGWRLNALGTMLFLVAIPLDYLWHLLFGLDNTAWSPPHLMLFYSAAPITLGVLLAWLAQPASRAGWGQAMTFGICALFVSNTLFPLSQLDYAAVVTEALSRSGRIPWYVTPELWAAAGARVQRLAEGNTPSWLYLVGTAALASAGLTCGRLILRAQWRGGRAWLMAWPATLLVMCVLFFRLLMRGTLILLAWPYAALTWWLLPLGVALDISWAFATWALAHDPKRDMAPRQLLTTLVITGAVGASALYAGIMLTRFAYLPVPSAPPEALPGAMVAGVAGALAGGVVGNFILRQARPSIVADEEHLITVGR